MDFREMTTVLISIPPDPIKTSFGALLQFLRLPNSVNHRFVILPKRHRFGTV